MDDFRKARQANGSNPSVNGVSKNAYNGPPHNTNSQRNSVHVSNANMYATANTPIDSGIGALTSGFGGMSLGALGGYAAHGKTNASIPSMHHGSAEYQYSGGSTRIPAQAYILNGQVIFGPPAPGSHYSIQPGTGMPAAANPYGQPNGPYLPPQSYAWQHYAEGSSPSQGFSSRMPSTSTDVPSLITPRRDSGSSKDHEGPGTPYTALTTYGHGGVTVVGHSPDSALTWTPSPYGAKHSKGTSTPTIPAEIAALIVQEPGIPEAVPAPYSPKKQLDRSLENPHGITNVYIRGLQPDTTDDMLYSYASRFGDIVSSKAILEHCSGRCKGFGFVKYHNYDDAAKCIRAFFFRGYEASFARESFYSQLKKLGDEYTTNLYVSNIPKEMNEHELAMFFTGFKVCSSRILRTPDGAGRGVGFARFDDRETCEEVIKKFNNTPVGITDENGEDQLISIRYADTPDQKNLKQQTAAARQYRTAEYESQTNPRINSLYSNARANGSGTASGSTAPNGDFETYMNNTTGAASGNSVGGRRVEQGSTMAHTAPAAHKASYRLAAPGLGAINGINSIRSGVENGIPV